MLYCIFFAIKKKNFLFILNTIFTFIQDNLPFKMRLYSCSSFKSTCFRKSSSPNIFLDSFLFSLYPFFFKAALHSRYAFSVTSPFFPVLNSTSAVVQYPFVENLSNKLNKAFVPCYVWILPHTRPDEANSKYSRIQFVATHFASNANSWSSIA